MITKNAFLTSVAVLSLASCGNNLSNRQQSIADSIASVSDNPNGVAKDETKKDQEYWQRLEMFEFRDGSGKVFCQLPLPASWKLNTDAKHGQPTFTGPKGVRVIDYPGKNFMYVHDQRLQQSYYQSGQQLRAMPGIDAVVQQDIIPVCQKQGLTYVKHYEVPEVTRVDQWYNDQLYKAVPSQTQCMAVGTEWTAANGDPYFLLMHISVSNSAEMQNWGYWCTGLEAEKDYQEKAKKQLLFGLANAHYPLEPIMAYNRSEAEKAGQSWAAHNQRMAQNQAAFETSQRAHINKSNAVNDAIMSGWQQRNASSDKQQEQFIDVINERTNVVDPSTGQKYKVSSGSNQYWMNSDGEYIGTNHVDYNPNLDDNMNEQKWQELKEVK